VKSETLLTLAVVGGVMLFLVNRADAAQKDADAAAAKSAAADSEAAAAMAAANLAAIKAGLPLPFPLAPR